MQNLLIISVVLQAIIAFLIYAKIKVQEEKEKRLEKIDPMFPAFTRAQLEEAQSDFEKAVAAYEKVDSTTDQATKDKLMKSSEYHRKSVNRMMEANFSVMNGKLIEDAIEEYWNWNG